MSHNLTFYLSRVWIPKIESLLLKYLNTINVTVFDNHTSTRCSLFMQLQVTIYSLNSGRLIYCYYEVMIVSECIVHMHRAFLLPDIETSATSQFLFNGRKLFVGDKIFRMPFIWSLLLKEQYSIFPSYISEAFLCHFVISCLVCFTCIGSEPAAICFFNFLPVTIPIW
jgi:hypothetical protein